MTLSLAGRNLSFMASEGSVSHIIHVSLMDSGTGWQEGRWKVGRWAGVVRDRCEAKGDR